MASHQSLDEASYGLLQNERVSTRDERDRSLVEAFGAAYTTDPATTPWGLTPRMACRLYSHALMISSLARDDPSYLTDDDWALPPVALRADPAFHQRFARCFGDLAERLRDPESTPDLTQCVGDEVALDTVLNVARDAWADGTERESIGKALTRLPECRPYDDDFAYYSDTLFQDRDFEVLWRPDLDGIEDDDALAGEFNLVNLRLDRWFLPFC